MIYMIFCPRWYLGGFLFLFILGTFRDVLSPMCLIYLLLTVHDFLCPSPPSPPFSDYEGTVGSTQMPPWAGVVTENYLLLSRGLCFPLAQGHWRT